jgi:uncharacterized protein (DUF1330 family)
MKPHIRAGIAPIIYLSVIIAVASIAGGSDASNWPQWRGPGGQGVSTEKNLPTEWTATKNIKWKTPIAGRGHSSPIVWGNKIFLTTAIEGAFVPGAKAVKHMDGDKEFLHPDSIGADHKHTFKVICLNAETGKILWEQTAYEGTPYDNRHRKSSFAASTPVTDGKLVYAFFGTEGLYAYDMSGKLAWKADLGKLGTVGMGTGTSPILYRDLLIVQCDEENGAASFIVALDKNTGKEMWKTPRKVQVSWSTPILVSTAKRTELIVSTIKTPRSNMMAAYLIVNIARITDEETYGEYRARVNQGLTAAGGEYLVRGGHVDVLEGDWTPSRVVVVKFPSTDAAKNWWNSPEYEELKRVRQASTVTNMVLVAGLEKESEE